jgi:hypothetical protein
MFSYTGSVVDYIVPTTAIYDIVAAGAQGGGGQNDSGGYGALASGDVALTAGTELQIAVGGAGLTGDFDGSSAAAGAAAVLCSKARQRRFREPNFILLLSTGLFGVVVVGRCRNKK